MTSALGVGPGDDLFGAGEADAFAAVSAVPAAPPPVAVISDNPVAATVPGSQDLAVTRALNQPAPTMASEKSAASEANRPAAQ